MKIENGRFVVYGNALDARQSQKTIKWQNMFIKKFHYDPNEKYTLSLEENPYLGPIFGLKNIVRGDHGAPIVRENAVICSTLRMGFGHFRIAMAGVSCARAMGFQPYWLDLLAIPGITTDVIGWCNDNYSRFSRWSQKSALFNKYVWESVTTGEPTLPGLNAFLNNWIVGWPWRFLKTNVKDYKMSELFRNLHQALPSDMPILTAHMWNCMGAVAGGMTNVVDMMFDNWPMAFQLTEGAKHAVQSPSGYYGFRTMRGFDDKNRILNPVPEDALYYTGHHVDHELVENIEEDCAARLQRMNDNQPRRFLLTMGGAGAQRELFKAIIEHCLPLIQAGKIALFVNLGDHKSNWDWLQAELADKKDMLHTHFTWEDTQAYADQIRTEPASGLHVFLFDNTFHAVYATNYMMRVVDVMITKPSELAFYPVPKIFNERVGGHEMWGAIRGAELGDGTVEARSIPQTLQAIDMLTHHNDLLEMFCDCIVKNKSIGVYDGGYKSVELATGKKFERKPRA
ncbi:DUF6938 domain-containing protein [Levilinea saccharolytica]|uniref:Uncharacterized protein n=1 Tax=Levilinea saccharolytica TaxID=229921 RepID=A0A0P6XCA0_9CHLR|nr:hypothetical protein [Levilinea saccharolytica]KPL80502.1 hypothetical protein ADN01_11810 [Levilinea saccharolytica]GAP16231.1 hypothetical protein LSAC_00080 [Levilinea saccharolytica]